MQGGGRVAQNGLDYCSLHRRDSLAGGNLGRNQSCFDLTFDDAAQFHSSLSGPAALFLSLPRVVLMYSLLFIILLFFFCFLLLSTPLTISLPPSLSLSLFLSFSPTYPQAFYLYLLIPFVHLLNYFLILISHEFPTVKFPSSYILSNLNFLVTPHPFLCYSFSLILLSFAFSLSLSLSFYLYRSLTLYFSLLSLCLIFQFLSLIFSPSPSPPLSSDDNPTYHSLKQNPPTMHPFTPNSLTFSNSIPFYRLLYAPASHQGIFITEKSHVFPKEISLRSNAIPGHGYTCSCTVCSSHI